MKILSQKSMLNWKLNLTGYIYFRSGIVYFSPKSHSIIDAKIRLLIWAEILYWSRSRSIPASNPVLYFCSKIQKNEKKMCLILSLSFIVSSYFFVLHKTLIQMGPISRLLKIRVDNVDSTSIAGIYWAKFVIGQIWKWPNLDNGKIWPNLNWPKFELSKFGIGQIWNWPKLELAKIGIGEITNWPKLELTKFLN